MEIVNIMEISRGLKKASTVFKNAKIINVYSKEIIKADLAVEDGRIVGVGTYDGINEIDCTGFYVAPGFIDAHVHIESSMLIPSGFAKIVVPKGTTTVIADPHEIANVSGIKGIEFMLKNSENIPLNVYMMIPSCVPAMKDEHSGAIITVKQIATLKNHPRVIGLGEVMDYPAVLQGDSIIFEKIAVMKDRIIDGHAPDLLGLDLNAYIEAGIMTDHECTIVESMVQRIRLGMYVHLREGSATRNTKTLLKGLKKEYIPRTLFCTDDKHPEDIRREGHINFNVNLAIESGMDPIDAIAMATTNAAECYRLNHLGAIAPGKDADLILFKDLKRIEPIEVYKKGILVAKDGKPLFSYQTSIPADVLNTVKFDENNISFDLKLSSHLVNVIGLIKNNITTHHLVKEVKLKDGKFEYNPKEDILKLAVIERHHFTKCVGVGLVEGFGIKNGAIATTIAHDSHNLIIVGSSDEDMMIAAKKIKEIQGGIVVVEHGKVIDYLQLEIAGIMTNQSESVVESSLSRMKDRIIKMGLSTDIIDPFIALAFLALPVIPKLKLTDRGLFDVENFKIISVEHQTKEKI